MRARRVRGAWLGAAIALATTAIAMPARALEDGAYGRLDGDLDLRLSAGASIARGGPSLAASFAALYLSTAGVYVHYADALGGDGPAVRRSIAAGVLLEPLFLGRYAKDMERGPPRLDLFVDSLAIGLGAFWDAPRGGTLGSVPGFEFSLGLGLPLLPRATGLVLGVRGALRVHAPSLAAPPGKSLLDEGALLSLTLTWRHIVPVHLVDAGDRPSR